MWYNFYKSRLNNQQYANYFKDKYAPFLDLIRPSTGHIIEAGCGTGLVTKLIYVPSNFYLLVDQDIYMLACARQKGLTLSLANIVTMHYPKASLIHSHGVLEHLSMSECKQVIQGQLKSAPYLVHYVPTNKYSSPSFGTEHLLSKAEWEDMLQPTESVAFNSEKDLILIWRKI